MAAGVASVSPALLDLFGAELVSKAGPVATADALAGKDYVLLYFSASWCPPCRGFTPVLKEFYEASHVAKNFEIVFVSSDRDDASFNEYFRSHHGGWLALPRTSAKKGSLSSRFDVEGIPTLAIVDKDGKTITTDGVESVAGDRGAGFPYKPKTVWEILTETPGLTTLVDKDGKTTPVEDLRSKKAIGIYFSAHWCGPCRAFTPELAAWYRGHAAALDLEIVFASSDRSERDFNAYLSEMPWRAIPFTSAGNTAKSQLSSLFKVRGIPTLVFVNPAGEVITEDGRSAVSSDPEGFPWPPKAVDALENLGAKINKIPTFVLFLDRVTDDASDVEVAFSTVAVMTADLTASGAITTKVQFGIGRAEDSFVDQTRNFLKLTRDAENATSIRLACVDIANQRYALFDNGTPTKLRFVSQEEIQGFVDSVVNGTISWTSMRG